MPFATERERDAYPTAAHGQPLDRRGLEREVAGIDQASGDVIIPMDGDCQNDPALGVGVGRGAGVGVSGSTSIL